MKALVVPSLGKAFRITLYYALLSLFLWLTVEQLPWAISVYKEALADRNMAWRVIARMFILCAFCLEALVVLWNDRSFARCSVARLLKFNSTHEADLYFWMLVSAMYIFLPSLLGYFPSVGALFPLYDLGQVLGSGVGTFLFLSFVAFGVHALGHRVPALWELHKIHHSANELTSLTVSREHVFFEMFHMALFVVFFDTRGFMLSKVFVARSFLYLLQHSQVNFRLGPLGHFIISPHAHRIHHQNEPGYHSKNLGLDITLWDRLFGTFLYEIPVPAREMEKKFGLPESESFGEGSYVLRDLLTSTQRALGRLSRPRVGGGS